VLPYCSDETLEQLEANLGGLPSMTQMLNSGMSTQDITDAILKDIGAIDAVSAGAGVCTVHMGAVLICWCLLCSGSRGPGAAAVTYAPGLREPHNMT
jgi:hypothetical protein